MRKILAFFRRHGFLTLLILIFLSGAFLRFWGISSVYQRVDDIPVAQHIEKIYHGNWRPDPVFYYPVFFNYIVAVCLRGLSAFLSFVGVHKAPGLFPFSFEQILFAARFLSALLGALTILLVYATGKRLYTRKEALLTSFFFSVSFIHIVFSHQIVLDVPMTFFYAWALLLCARLLEKRGWVDYLAAGFLCGLTIATKYNGLFILAALFLGHFLGHPAAKKKLCRAVGDTKLYGAGLASLVGFVAAHPYALIKFRYFLRSSALLIRIVHETEYYLKPIQPRTGFEYIQYNKYFLALKNILTAEGMIFFLMITAGMIWVLIRRSKSNVFLALSGLAYFLGALGFLGFSRYRDIPPLAIIYSFLAMLGLQACLRLFRRPALKKAISYPFFAFVLISLEFSALAKTYFLWEDDTTEVAERWIRRNLPEGSFFGKEWFTPPTYGQDYSYPSFSAPFLFSRNFAPYERFDFVITSSAAYGHFFRNQKFYPDVIRIYRNLREKNELVKRFFFRDFEYKNPEVNIFAMGRPSRPKQRLALPRVLPLENLPREFEMVDGSPYGKTVCSFFLDGEQKATRIFVSRHRIRDVVVFATALEGSGNISIRTFLKRKRLPVEAGETTHVRIRPWLSFPFFRHVYRITVSAPPSLKRTIVKLCYDDFDIGREFFELSDFRTARHFFLRALVSRPFHFFDLELYLYLARCARELGLLEEAQKYEREASTSPFFRRYLNLFQTNDSMEAWVYSFEKMSGIDFKLFEQTLTTTVDDAAFALSGGRRVHGSRFFRGTGSLLTGEDSDAAANEERQGNKGKEGWVEALSSEIGFLPLDYRLEFMFSGPNIVGENVGELEIVSTSGNMDDRAVFPLILDSAEKEGLAKASFFGSAANLGQWNRLIIRVRPGQNLALDYLKIIPDIRAYFNRKLPLVQEFLERGKVRPEDGQE